MTASLLTLSPLLVYAALFGLIAGESAGLPLPGETSLIAASALAAHRASVSIVIVVAVAACAAIAGDNIGFALGRRGGRWILSRDGRWEDSRRRYLEHGERFFERHGPKAVFLARWVPGLRVVGAWLAGTHHMRWRSFLLWNTLGGIAWATSVGVAAYLLGQAAGGLFQALGLVAGGLIVIAAAVAGTVMWLKRRRGRPHVSGQSPLPDTRSCGETPRRPTPARSRAPVPPAAEETSTHVERESAPFA
jgi:membrane-associated protein